MTEDGRALWAADPVLQKYSRNDIDSLHDKNLYDLGEDRMLTTILLSTYPGMKLSFVPEATCWTVVPDTYAILLSQRRRWINSTFHNLMELLKVETMCGLFCFSMKLVVILDIISTMILPASLIQACYFIYATVTAPQNADILVLILYGIIFGSQMLTFILRSRTDHFFWFFLFMTVGTPIFYFILPIYSFWNMDDISWGKTRELATPANQDEMKDNFFGDKESDGIEETEKTSSRGLDDEESPIVVRKSKKAKDSSSRRLNEPRSVTKTKKAKNLENDSRSRASSRCLDHDEPIKPPKKEPISVTNTPKKELSKKEIELENDSRQASRRREPQVPKSSSTVWSESRQSVHSYLMDVTDVSEC